jgi:hypothetical protein
MNSSKNEFLDKIKQDLIKTGFISELRCAKLAKSKNWHVTQNSNYLDLDSGKSREFDLDVSRSYSDLPNFIFHLQLNIEVKKSNKPWVIFTEDIGPMYNWFRLPGFDTILAIDNFSTDEVLDANGFNDGHMRLGSNYTGRNFCEAFKNPDEPSKIFESVISISKASLYSKEINMSPTAKKQIDDPSKYY